MSDITPKNILKNFFVEVTLKNEDIVNSQRPLGELARTEFPVILSYKMSKTLKKINDQVELFNKRRNAVLEKHGKLDPSKGPDGEYDFEEGKKEVAQKEIEDILAEELKLSIIKVKLDEFKDVRNADGSPYTIKPGVLALLDWFIEE